MFRRITTIIIATSLLGAISQAQNTPEPSTFFMTFVPNIQFAQMYVGLEKGYFEDAGYDLTLEYGAEPDGVELIALGQRSFGLIAGEQIIVARANNRPVVSVYEWWQQYPIAIVTDAGSGINAPTDLLGRTVGVPGRFGATYSGLAAFLAANNLTESDINLQEIGFNAPEVVCLGAVEAAVVYGNNEPLQIAARATANDCDAVSQVRVFPVADYADLVSNGLVTSEDLIANQPERVRAMVYAFDRAVQNVINNPAEAYLISASYVDNLPLPDDLRQALTDAADKQRAFLAERPPRTAIIESRRQLYEDLNEAFDAETLLQLQVLLQTIDYWDADRPGIAEASSWELTQNTLIQMDFIDEPINVNDAFTNDFIPQ